MTSRFALLLVFLIPYASESVQILSRDNASHRSAEGVGTVHVLLGRAVFDYQDHVKRVAAIRDTWGSAPDVKLHVLDFGKDIFESGYKDWCRGCPASAYATAPDEMKIPEEILKSQLYAVDGHVWAMKEAMADANCNWILIGQDMISLNLDNMRSYLAKQDPYKKLVLGNRLEGYPGRQVSVSPWGYLLSRGAAQALVRSWEGVRGFRSMIDRDPNLRVHGGSTDDGMSLVLHKLGAEFLDTRDEEGRDRMLLWPPTRIQQHSWYDDWYPGRRIDKVKKELSPETFLFFFAGPNEIRELGNLYQRRGPLAGVSTMYSATTLQLLDPMISHSARI